VIARVPACRRTFNASSAYSTMLVASA
jgi:hypothetical protein